MLLLLLLIVETNRDIPTNVIATITIFFENLFFICTNIVTKLYIRIVDNLIQDYEILIFIYQLFFFSILLMILKLSYTNKIKIQFIEHNYSSMYLIFKIILSERHTAISKDFKEN
jgi:hypothetical protein